MNWDAIGAVGELVSGIAVIATLVYLAKQIRDSARQQRMDSHRAISEEFNRINDIWLSLDNTGMMVRAWSDWEGATAQEQHMSGVFFMKVMNHLQTMFLLWESGTVDDSVYEAEEEMTCAFLATNGGQTWWELFQQGFSSRLRDRINSKLSSNGHLAVTELIPYWHKDHWPASS
ncbi:MAG: hypothetical protein GTN98_07630 [Woeseiaceae bacterium]|nr:hypothetical protein [Woeseiaceae bacterium]